MEPYAPIAEYYDSEHDDFADDLAWYLHLASVTGPRVLELGCGSGRILGPLAVAGHNVVGLDSSEAMLQRARARLQTAISRGEVKLVHGLVQQLRQHAPGSYDLVILSLNGLLHLDSAEEQRRVLVDVAEVLRPGGVFATDAMLVLPDSVAAFDGRVVHEGSWSDGERTISKFSARTLDWTNQHIESEIWYDVTAPTGALQRYRTAVPMRWVTPAELSLLLEVAGFADWSIAGDYDGSPLTDLSDRMLVAARTPESS